MRHSLLLLLAACGGSAPGPVEADQGLTSRIAVALDTDVQSVTLTATEVDCVTGLPIPDGAVHTGEADLLGMSLADFGLPIDPLSPDSTHDFTDIFLLVEPGCYDLVAQPLDADGNPSEDCSVAISDGPVEVVDGQTTEVLLLSQCDGQESGGLDTIIAFNEAPTITDVTYEPSKFTDTCEPVVVCVEATDPNGDPMEFEWTVDPGLFEVVSFEQNGDIAVECIEILPTEPGDVTIDVVVYDLLADGTRIEDYLASIGNPQDSHHAMTMPLHVAGDPAAGNGGLDDTDGDGIPDACDICPEGDDTLDADGDGVPDACDICELGDDNVDEDGNGVPDACEPCDDFVPTEFQWVEWTFPVSGNSVSGQVAGIPVTYTSSSPLLTTGSVYNHSTFPASYGVPNGTTLRNDVITQNTLTFASPVVNPVLAFASVGTSSTSVPVSFGQPIDVLWSTATSNITTNGFTGNEGFVIVQIPGVHTQLDFEYLANETYVNFVFGAAGDANIDTDGDGIPDVCDACPDDPDPACQ